MIKTRSTWREKWLAREDNSLGSSVGMSEGGSLVKVDDEEQTSRRPEKWRLTWCSPFPGSSLHQDTT
jgi:hypothetical protein